MLYITSLVLIYLVTGSWYLLCNRFFEARVPHIHLPLQPPHGYQNPVGVNIVFWEAPLDGLWSNKAENRWLHTHPMTPPTLSASRAQLSTCHKTGATNSCWVNECHKGDSSEVLIICPKPQSCLGGSDTQSTWRITAEKTLSIFFQHLPLCPQSQH